MATLQIKQKQNTISDKSKQTLYTKNSTQTKQQQQQQYHHRHYYHQHKQNKDIVEDEKDFSDFYHIKLCYQPTKITTNTLNQQNNFIYNKATLKTSAATILSHVLHSLSHNCRSFFTMLLMGYLLLVHYAMAAPQSCILCDKNDLLAKDPQTNFEEFLFEHQVTRQDAINALRQLNDSFYEGKLKNGLN